MAEVILKGSEIREHLQRITREILEREGGANRIGLIGVRTRGAYLVGRIAKQIASDGGPTVPTGSLDIKWIRDSMTGLKRPILREANVEFDVEQYTCVLVDDVHYTGQTARIGVNYLMSRGWPRPIRFAVLVDRRPHDLPLRADYVGVPVETSPNQYVNVFLQEPDGDEKVILDERVGAASDVQSRVHGRGSQARGGPARADRLFSPVDPELRSALEQKVELVHDLPERQRRVLALWWEGFESPGVAENMKVSTKTIETYATRIFEALGLPRRADHRSPRTLAVLVFDMYLRHLGQLP